MLARNDERLDRGASEAAVDRRPNDDVRRPRTGGDEDLLAIEHVLVAVEGGGGGDRGGVRAEARLGDGHGGPHLAESCELLVGRHRSDGGVTQALVGQGQHQADVAVGGLHRVDDRLHVAAVDDSALGALLHRVTATAGRTRTRCSRGCQPVVEGGERVQLNRVCMLGEVVLAGNRPEHLEGGLPRLVDVHGELLREFETDSHDCAFSLPGRRP